MRRFADEDELDLPVEEQLSRQRRKGRDLKSQIELASGKIRAVEASRDELDGALTKARDDIAARDATAKELDAKLADYAEMIPKWERKMEDERREEEATRKRQQAEEVAVIQAMADEMVAEVRRELVLERDAKATVEFQLSQVRTPCRLFFTVFRIYGRTVELGWRSNRPLRRRPGRRKIARRCWRRRVRSTG
jgi:chromosome segregation ATPase